MATKIGRIVADSLNEYADHFAQGRGVPNHTPADPVYWFRGLARDAGDGLAAIWSLLSDDAKALLGCACVSDPEATCCACAFGAHTKCADGCGHLTGGYAGTVTSSRLRITRP